MSENDIIQKVTEAEYEHGFETDIEQEYFPKGLNEDIIGMISRKRRSLNGCLSLDLKPTESGLQ
jgi:hypothetical protein